MIGQALAALDAAQQAQVRAAVQGAPPDAGIDLTDWYWQVVRQFVSERFGLPPVRSGCLTYLHQPAHVDVTVALV
ncbi:MAG: hypothetical protein AB7P40_14595 [Chloroflexota bacterium]